MAATREQIYTALWDLFLNHPSVQGKFVLTSRYLQHFDSVEPAQMPALFITQTGETHDRVGRGVSFRRTYHSHLVMYSYSSDPAAASPYQSTLVNTMLEVINEVLPSTPDPSNAQTLGGLVYQAFIAGEIEIAEGLLQGKSIIDCPIDIIVP